MKYIYSVLVCFLFIGLNNILGDELPFQSSTISECFGPRIHPVSGLWQSHSGIDYNPLPGNQDIGMPIKCVEAGRLIALSSFGSGGLALVVKSGNNTWAYLHIFDSGKSSDKSSGGFTLGKNEKGVYIDRKAMLGYEARRMYLDGTSIVAKGESIAPIGISGIGTGAHLHLQLNNGNDNPLVVLEHEASKFEVAMINPQEGSTLNTGDLRSNFPIRFRINSKQGKDIDKVRLSLDGKEVSSPGISFGGRVGEGPRFMQPSNDGSQNGVDPDKTNSFTKDFILNCDFNSLSEGEHSITCDVLNAKGVAFSSIHKFNVKAIGGWVGTADIKRVINSIPCSYGTIPHLYCKYLCHIKLDLRSFRPSVKLFGADSNMSLGQYDVTSVTGTAVLSGTSEVTHVTRDYCKDAPSVIGGEGCAGQDGTKIKNFPEIVISVSGDIDTKKKEINLKFSDLPAGYMDYIANLSGWFSQSAKFSGPNIIKLEMVADQGPDNGPGGGEYMSGELRRVEEKTGEKK